MGLFCLKKTSKNTNAKKIVIKMNQRLGNWEIVRDSFCTGPIHPCTTAKPGSFILFDYGSKPRNASDFPNTNFRRALRSVNHEC